MIGTIAKPDGIIFTPDLPKTRSGKIMRRLLRDVARGNTARRRHDARRTRRSSSRSGSRRRPRRARSDAQPGRHCSGAADRVRRRRRGSRYLATTRRDGTPHVVPISPVLDLDRLVFATETDTREGSQHPRQPCVAICFDAYDEDWSELQQVMLHRARRTSSSPAPEFERDRSLLYEQVPQYETEAPIEEGTLDDRGGSRRSASSVWGSVTRRSRDVRGRRTRASQLHVPDLLGACRSHGGPPRTGGRPPRRRGPAARRPTA